MEDMIRIDSARQKSTAPLWIGACVALIAMIGALSVIWVARDTLVDDGQIILGGIAIVSLLTLATLIVMIRSRKTSSKQMMRAWQL